MAEGSATALRPAAREHAVHASEWYGEVAAALGEMTQRFVFPQGGQPNEPTQAEWAIATLERARAAETRGVQALENLLESLNDAP